MTAGLCHMLWVACLLVLSACDLMAKHPATIKVNYQQQAVTQKIQLRHLGSVWTEPMEEAKKRLFAQVSCPYEIIEEGVGTDMGWDTEMTRNPHAIGGWERNAVPDPQPYYWVTYRCRK